MLETVWWLYRKMSLFVKNTHQYLGVMEHYANKLL